MQTQIAKPNLEKNIQKNFAWENKTKKKSFLSK